MGCSDIDQFTVVNGASSPMLSDRVLDVFRRDGAVGYGNKQAIMMGDTDVNRHESSEYAVDPMRINSSMVGSLNSPKATGISVVS